MTENTRNANGTTVVLGGTGKTGRKVAERLEARGLPVRIGSRSGTPPFEWGDRSTWGPVLEDAGAVYVTYFPDLTVPGAADDIRALASAALAAGARRLVMLSGRGEEEAQVCEQELIGSGAEWTILRSSWFMQNFSEDFLRDGVMDGTLAIPAGDVPEPFADTGDVADVAVAALTEDGHAGEIYEITGPRALTFAEAAAEIGAATGRDIAFVPVPVEEYTAVLKEHGLPDGLIQVLVYLFTTVLDGRNALPADGVRRALGREPRDFADFARDAAAGGAWDA
jgi:uncharacterized protein YbjT (DUF2867 family)